MRSVACDLVRSIQQSWPIWLPPVIQQDGIVKPKHLLAAEVSALLNGRPASLPYFDKNQPIAWMTLAPDSDSILASLTDLRAWIVPSIGWEDVGKGTIVTTASGALGSIILALSPAGYIRWRSLSDSKTLHEIAHRLVRARELTESVPDHVQAPLPSLIELRQQLATALAANNRYSAEDMLATINRLQLDTAPNALLSRLRVLDHFGDSRLVVEMPELEQLLRLRLPQKAQIAISKAFYRYFVEPNEIQDRISTAREVFATEVAPKIGSLIDAIRIDAYADIANKRLAAYRLVSGVGSVLQESLSEYTDDPVIATLLSLVQPKTVPTPLSDEELFFAAWQISDWTEVQRLGMLQLPTHPEIVPILKRSLDRLPNALLRDTLAELQTPTTSSSSGSSSPQTWAE